VITTIIIVACVIFSLVAFNNPAIFEKYLFSSYAITHYKQYYRIFTHAFLHGDYIHLTFNMFALYSFGKMVEEQLFPYYFGPGKALIYYILLYVGGIVVSSIHDLIDYKDDTSYRSVGASGAVNAVIFSFILMEPKGMIGFFFIPMPAWIFGVLFLGYSWYMSKRRSDNIGHNAHFWGALYGFAFTLVLQPSLFSSFLNAMLPGRH
jgi:membrane associated rhomboid family serine protease